MGEVRKTEIAQAILAGQVETVGKICSEQQKSVCRCLALNFLSSTMQNNDRGPLKEM